MIDAGVAHALARWRAARYRDVAIAIDAEIDTRATRLRGWLDLALTLARPAPIVLDWKPAAVPPRPLVIVNGAAMGGARLRNEHLIVPAGYARAGRNRLRLAFEAPIARAGRALVRWRDPADGALYVYSLFVPAEARSVFPCFDQPDLKARFTLRLTTPAVWRVIANAAPARAEKVAPGRARHVHRPTEPISTYLFAFAAGPFAALEDSQAVVRTRFWVRRAARNTGSDARAVLAIARAGTAFFTRYLRAPFPFAKHDLVAIPGFPFGGMEHAGATFLREEAVLPGARATRTQHARRRQLVLHETAHQWMGDSVTMRWFDDLWLKEGFANFLAAKALTFVGHAGEARATLASLKDAALATDESPGATPVHQRLANLEQAKSLYGAIVYGKAPAVLAEAERFIGPRAFQRAVRSLVREHRYASFDRHDLVRALEAAARRDLKAWARAWIATAGAPHLSAAREGRRARIRQSGARTVWPMVVDAIAIGPPARRVTIEMTRADQPLGIARGAIIIDPNAASYARIDCDAATARALLRTRRVAPDVVADRLWRALGSGALTVAAMADYLLERLDRFERIEPALARLEIVARRYRAADDPALLERIERRLVVLGRSDPAYLRAFAACAASAGGVARLSMLLARGAPPIANIAALRLVLLGIVTPAVAARRLGARRAPDANAMLRAAAPTLTAKGAALRELLAPERASDATLERVLPWLAAPEHAELHRPLLAVALGAVPHLRDTRSIFIVNRWLEAFVAQQTDAERLPIVRAAAKRLDPALRRKFAEARRELERTIRIRRRSED